MIDAELEEDTSIWHGEIIDATNVREIEKNDYDTFHKDYYYKHAYDMLMHDLIPQSAHGTQDRNEKAESKATKVQAKADAQGVMMHTTTTRDALADFTATCEQKASDFESRQQLRTDDIVAIGKAIEIFPSGAVAGSAEEHLPSRFQKASSLAALQAVVNMQAKTRVAQYLASRAKQLNNWLLVSTITACVNDDPFNKDKNMSKDLIMRLMEEANEEARIKDGVTPSCPLMEAVETLHAESTTSRPPSPSTEDISNLTTMPISHEALCHGVAATIASG